MNNIDITKTIKIDIYENLMVDLLKVTSEKEFVLLVQKYLDELDKLRGK